MQKILLNNGIILVSKKVKNTPRIALTCFVKIDKSEKIAGIYAILNRLFTQGTISRNAEQIAYEVEKNGLDIYSEMKSDYWKFSLLCLKEDFEIAVELLADMMQNSTFENFDKEILKFKGETVASLDSPVVKARDAFVSTLYENHQYGNTGSVILENLDKFTQEDIRQAYNDVFVPAEKVFSIVGDIEKDEAKLVLDKYFGKLASQKTESKLGKVSLEDKKVVKLSKQDANQAQIYQGWIVPGLQSEDAPALSVLNTILGSSGLSSRLFLELRDKKGLAYTVRSMYTKAREVGDFRVYIATEPKNIKISLDGFKVEIDKLKNELVEAKELTDAKNNILGKIQFLTETNLQQSGSMGVYELEGLGCDYLDKWINSIMNVTSEDVMRVANKYLVDDKYALTVLAPEKDMEVI